LTLTEQQNFVWEAFSESTKRQDMPEILGAYPLFSLPTPMLRSTAREIKSPLWQDDRVYQHDSDIKHLLS